MIDSMARRTLVWRWVDGYLIEVAGSSSFTQDEWRELMAEIAKLRMDLRGVLVASGSASPSATQRAQLKQALQGATVQAAVLSNSALVRVALTAINFFVQGRARFFAPDQLEPALTYLKVPELLWSKVRQTIAGLKAELGG
jgi:hypothetical protein